MYYFVYSVIHKAETKQYMLLKPLVTLRYALMSHDNEVMTHFSDIWIKRDQKRKNTYSHCCVHSEHRIIDLKCIH
jgi:hypothetical protein